MPDDFYKKVETKAAWLGAAMSTLGAVAGWQGIHALIPHLGERAGALTDKGMIAGAVVGSMAGALSAMFTATAGAVKRHGLKFGEHENLPPHEKRILDKTVNGALMCAFSLIALALVSTAKLDKDGDHTPSEPPSPPTLLR